MDAPSALVAVENLCRTFGRKKALDGISFQVRGGEAVLLSGPNGAGKTTLLRILSGYAPATSGSGAIAGLDLFFDDVDERLDIRQHIGYVPEALPLYDEMLVGEYLRFRGRLRGLFGSVLRRHFGDALEACGLGEYRASVIGKLSRGIRARVALADAILHRPKVLLLDDPLASVDAAQRRAFVETLRVTCEGRALIFATHTPDDAARLFSRALLLDRGRLVLDAPLDPAHPPASLSATVTGWLLDLAP